MRVTGKHVALKRKAGKDAETNKCYIGKLDEPSREAETCKTLLRHEVVTHAKTIIQLSTVSP